MRSQLGQQWRGLTAGVIAGLAWTAAKVAVPALVAVAIDRGIGDDSNTALLRWSLAILVAGVVAGVCSGLRRWYAFREARWSEAVLRDRIFAHLQRLHFAFHDEVQTGQLMSRANTDLQQVQAFVVMIPITISNAATVLAAAVIIVQHQPAAHAARARATAVRQRAGPPVLEQPLPLGDGDPGRVGRAGDRGRGDRVAASGS